MGIGQSFRCHLLTKKVSRLGRLWHELPLREYCRQVESLCLGESLAAIPWFPFNAPWYSECWTALGTPVVLRTHGTPRGPRVDH